MMQMSLYATKEPAKEYEKFKSDANIFCILILISFLSDPGVPGVRSMGPVLSH